MDLTSTADATGSCCRCSACRPDEFAAPATEAAFQHFCRMHDRAPFIVCCASLIPLAVVLAILVLDERSGDYDAPVAASVAGFALCVIGAAVVTVVTMRAEACRNELRGWHFYAMLALCALLMASANFARPSLVGDDLGYLLVTTSAMVALSGASLRRVLAAQLLLLVEYYILIGTFKQQLTPFGVVYAPVANLGLWSGAVYRVAQLRALFETGVQARQALAEEEAHKRIRLAIMDGRIPRQLQHRVDEQSICGGEPTVQTNSVDDVVVVAVQLAGEAEWGTTAAHAADPQALHDTVEASLAVVEAALQQSTRHRTLDIVRRAGGSVLIAGPLDARAGTVAQASDDALLLLEALLGSGLRFTAGVAVEQLINVIHEGQFPTHDVFGMAVAHATALVAAAPAPMVVATEKFARGTYGTRSSTGGGAGGSDPTSPAPDMRAPPQLTFCAAESWRIRGVGALRVCRAAAPSLTDPQQPSVGSGSGSVNSVAASSWSINPLRSQSNSGDSGTNSNVLRLGMQ